MVALAMEWLGITPEADPDTGIRYSKMAWAMWVVGGGVAGLLTCLRLVCGVLADSLCWTGRS